MTFDIPPEFIGSYTNGVEDIEIEEDGIYLAGMAYEDFLNASLGGMGKVSGFTQSSSAAGRYSCNVTADVTVQGMTIPVIVTLTATLSSDGDELLIMISGTGMEAVQETYTRL